MQRYTSCILFFVFYISPCCVHDSVSGELSREKGTYRTHDELIEMFRDECERYPEATSFGVIGKTTLQNDIWAFRIGNPEAPKIIIDGCLHGWEDLGSEISFLWIKWLLESKNPEAKRILENTCWIVIPVVNADTYDRGNMNRSVCSGGVDLNRNFLSGWKYVPACEGPFGTSHGESAGSEKETQVMRAFMNANKPANGRKHVYINTHYGGGPWIHYHGTDAGYYSDIRGRLLASWRSVNIILKNVPLERFLPETARDPAPGGAGGDAATFGFESFTVEVVQRSCQNGRKFGPIDAPCGEGSPVHPSFEEVQNELYPIWEPFYKAISESVMTMNGQKQ